MTQVPRVPRFDFASLLLTHQRMLHDRARNRAFGRALATLLVPRAAVLDLGAGIGLWAVEAARLGARRVVAVERDRRPLPLIRQLAAENGVADRVEVRCGDSRRLELGERFDLIVSETIGSLGFDEGIVPILADARRRFLKPGGSLIPRRVALAAAPVVWPSPHNPTGIALRVAAFGELARHVAVSDELEGVRLLAPPATLVEVDLQRAEKSPDLSARSARFRVGEGRRVRGVLVWTEAELAPGLRLRTRRGTHWAPVLLPCAPFSGGPGSLSVEMCLAGAEWIWRVIFTGPGGTEEQVYSPRYARAWLALRQAAPPGRRKREA
jgi:protein arginine N-methyltransferase 1